MLGGSKRRYASIGDVFVATVKDAIPAPPSRRATSSSAWSCAPEGKRRPDGSYIRFDENAAVIINDQAQPAHRIFGPRGRLSWDKSSCASSLAPEVL